MTRRRIDPSSTEASQTSSEAPATMASSNNAHADLLALQRQIAQLTALQQQSQSLQDHAYRPALQTDSTLYDEWARNSPWEQAMARDTAHWAANLPMRGAPYDPLANNQLRGYSRGGQSVPHAPVTRFDGESQGKTEPESPEKYSKPFCDFLTENPTIFHAVKYFEGKLQEAGYEKVWLTSLPPHYELIASFMIMRLTTMTRSSRKSPGPPSSRQGENTTSPATAPASSPSPSAQTTRVAMVLQ